jgi:hypothetical protein
MLSPCMAFCQRHAVTMLASWYSFQMGGPEVFSVQPAEMRSFLSRLTSYGRIKSHQLVHNKER